MKKKRFSEKEYHVPFFDEEGYVRKLCPKCGEFFWTLNPEMVTCGEATFEGCSLYTFINNPPTRRAYNLREMREAFLSFFEKRGHKRMKSYPVVARWRDDLYLTSASIVDFQPYVTNGITPPPANPLVISQVCIRLVDVDNTGPTFGRHGTIFEMGGHHAFNYPDKEIYWKDDTVRYHHEFVTRELGIPPDEVVYKEHVWSGGGNAGPDLETVVRGLELATLVFMKFRVVNGEFVELPIRTVDTGYGIERYTWISQGAVSGFHAIYGPILDSLFKMTKIKRIDYKLLGEVASFSGAYNLDKSTERGIIWEKAAEHAGMTTMQLAEFLRPIENAFAVADHTKSLAFMLAEGVVPSNVQEGYLTRLLIRRTYRLLKTLGIENHLDDIMELQINEWSKDFPHLKEMHSEILEVLSVERQKFEDTLRRGSNLVTRIARDLKSKGKRQIPTVTLLELYDSHGLPPEAVKDYAAKIGMGVEISKDFYKMVAERHLQAPPKELAVDERLGLIADLPETRMLYYENAYLRKFESRVLRVLDRNKVVLEQTNFYPEGGGQPGDKGRLEFDGKKADVTDVKKVGNIIIHTIKGEIPQERQRVKGSIDWDRRSYLMKAHTATHLVMGAARRVLGQHVWQSGTQKNVEQARLDISHFRRLTSEEANKIETLANQAVIDTISVETQWLPRDKAEAKYGYRLYQGGAVPGVRVRVVKVGDWEVEACAGTHVKNTGEIGFLKILRTERVQDGVERIVYSTGRYAVAASQEKEKLLQQISETLGAPMEKLYPTTQRLLKEWKNTRRENKRLIEEIAGLESGKRLKQTAEIKEIEDIKIIIQEFSPLDVDRMIKTASKLTEKESMTVALFYGKDEKTARIVVMAGKTCVKKGANASEIAKAAAKIIGGGGSGRSDFAQGGGNKISSTNDAIQKAEEILRAQLKTHRKPK
ncbi:MAG: alanine--tRNA ligase [Candidatus Bathyarchaeota archaeon]|nr:MAG: alanine--tRNA ligase [Candidatus Bathyarchaeota archaeon]